MAAEDGSPRETEGPEPGVAYGWSPRQLPTRPGVVAVLVLRSDGVVERGGWRAAHASGTVGRGAASCQVPLLYAAPGTPGPAAAGRSGAIVAVESLAELVMPNRSRALAWSE